MNDHEATLRRWLTEHRGILVRISRAYAAAPGDEEDLMQEILLALWQSLPSFRGTSKASTWVYQVALHVALSRRRLSRHWHARVPLDEVAEPSAGGEAEVFGRLRWHAVVGAVRQLAPLDRAVLVLGLEGASQQDIAHVLGVSANAAGVRLHRARRKLAGLLEG